jgi:hypothetical protein
MTGWGSAPGHGSDSATKRFFAALRMTMYELSSVVCLQHDSNVVQSPYKLPFPGKEAVHLFFFDTIKLWEIPGAFSKQEGIEGLLPLLPLAQDGVHYDVVDDMIASLERAGKSNLFSLAYNFASLVFKSKQDQDWLRKRFAMLSGDMLEDSWAYREMTAEARQKGIEKGLREGELQARREAVLDIVQERFPPLLTLVSSHIQNIDDTTFLRRLIVKLSAAQTVQEAEQTFRALVKDAQQH